MKSRFRKALIFSLLIGISGLVVLFIVALNRLPRTHLSQKLRFLKSYQPVRSRFVDQGYTYTAVAGVKPREVVALVEEFEVPVGFTEAHSEIRDQLKPIAYTTTYRPRDNPPTTLYGVIDKSVNEGVVITLTGTGPSRSTIVFKQTLRPTWLDLQLERIRNGFARKE